MISATSLDHSSTGIQVKRTYLAVISVILFAAISVSTGAQSPIDEKWLSFLEWNPGESRLPEDDGMGLLADRRNPDPIWSDALIVCDQAVSAIIRGDVPVNQIHPSVRVPLSLEFERALEDGSREFEPRYGLPLREGNRVSIPVRFTGNEVTGTGVIYLSRLGNQWYIDQWAVDLIPFK